MHPKKHISSVAILVVLFFAFACCSPGNVRAEDIYGELESAEARLADLQQQADEAAGDLESLEDETSELNDKYAFLANRSAEQRVVYEAAMLQKKNALQKLKFAEEGYQAAFNNMQNKKTQYCRRLAQMSKWRGKSTLQLFLESNDLQSFFTTVKLMQLVANADKEALDELKKAALQAQSMKKEAEEQRKKCETELKEAEKVLTEIKDNTAVALDELNMSMASLSERQQTYDAIKSKLETAEGDVNYYQNLIDEYEKKRHEQLEKERQAQEEKERQEQEAKEHQKPSSASGWVWPTPSCYDISRGVGDFDPEWDYVPHRGTDIAAGCGAEVISALPGEVTEAGYHDSYGNHIIVSCGAYDIVYAHLSDINVMVGDVVNAGDLLGWVGSTGNSSGCHLHFEVRSGGDLIDPIEAGFYSS